MGYSIFKLAGIPIKNPKTFKIEVYTLTKSTRVANGDMVMDFVANKRKFYFGYDAITSRDLDIIIEICWGILEETKQCFFELEYMDGTEAKSAVVYSGSIPKNLHRGDGANWVWKDVQFSLIER